MIRAIIASAIALSSACTTAPTPSCQVTDEPVMEVDSWVDWGHQCTTFGECMFTATAPPAGYIWPYIVSLLDDSIGCVELVYHRNSDRLVLNGAPPDRLGRPAGSSSVPGLNGCPWKTYHCVQYLEF